jgi:hypothetical protein
MSDILFGAFDEEEETTIKNEFVGKKHEREIKTEKLSKKTNRIKSNKINNDLNKKEIEEIDLEIEQDNKDTFEKINSDGENENKVEDPSLKNSYKSLSTRVNKILNDKNYVSTDDMNTSIILNAGGCYHENISPKTFNGKCNNFKRLNMFIRILKKNEIKIFSGKN